jgi:hypothetical protein
MTGPGLTVLAILGIICMAALLIAIAVLLVQEGLRLRRLLLDAKVTFRQSDTPSDDVSPLVGEIETLAQPERPTAASDVPPGWGFGGKR